MNNAKQDLNKARFSEPYQKNSDDAGRILFDYLRNPADSPTIWPLGKDPKLADMWLCKCMQHLYEKDKHNNFSVHGRWLHERTLSHYLQESVCYQPAACTSIRAQRMIAVALKGGFASLTRSLNIHLNFERRQTGGGLGAKIPAKTSNKTPVGGLVLLVEIGNLCILRRLDGEAPERLW